MISLSSQPTKTWQPRLMQPLWAHATLLLAGLIMLGGPAACIVHCWVLDAIEQGHHTHGSTGLTLDSSHLLVASSVVANDHACPEATSQSQHSEHNGPTALTIAIVLLLVLLPLIGAAAYTPASRTFHARGSSIPPPFQPPSFSNCFTS